MSPAATTASVLAGQVATSVGFNPSSLSRATCRVEVLEFRVWGLGFRVWGLGFWGWVLGFGVGV